MSKQANKTVIGFFVVGAIALVIAAVLILGSGEFFRQRFKAVCYFEGDVGGLNMGAPVVFRGVKIGSVTEVVLRYNPQKLSVRIPVYIDIEPKKIQVEGPIPKTFGQNLNALINQGLRAQLETQSIVTGQMQVGLDFHPDKPAKFVGVDTKTPEIPTIPTPMQELAKKIQNIPIDEIFAKLNSALSSIDKLVSSPEIPEAIHSVKLALEDVRKLVKDVDGQIGPLASNLNEATQEVRKLVQNVDNRIDPLATGIGETIKSAEATLRQAQKTIESIQGTVGEDSTLNYELNRTLEEVSELARSIRVLSGYLQRHPESVIWGK
jgi:paraquat-inducible protein B